MKTKKKTKKTVKKPSAKIEAWEWPASEIFPAFFLLRVGKKYYRIFFGGWGPCSESDHNESLGYPYSSLPPAKARKVNAARLKGVRPW